MATPVDVVRAAVTLLNEAAEEDARAYGGAERAHRG